MKTLLMKNLTKRYLLALGLIALLSTTAYFNLIYLIKTQDSMAATINTSGRQRMLSQKIALLSLQLVNSKDPDERLHLRKDIYQATTLMENSHNTLSQSLLSPELKAIYFSSPHYLDTKIKKFIGSTYSLLKMPDQQLSRNTPELTYLLNTANGNLLNSLDLAVGIYQKESEAHITKLKHLELIILLLTLFVLILIAVFIFRPMIRLIYRETKQLTDANFKLLQLSSVDGLTGIANRRYFDQYYAEMWHRSLLDTTWLAIIMVDIDYFKNFNDTYGHQQGDQCLVQVATALSKTLQRNRDLLARYGGEEFIVILPDTDLEGAASVAEKLRLAIEQLNIPHTASKIAEHVTISLGVAGTIPSMATSADYLIKRADVALYEAKNGGRNQVRVSKSIFKGFISLEKS